MAADAPRSTSAKETLASRPPFSALRIAVITTAMLMIAAVPAAFANGFFQQSDRSDLAHQLGGVSAGDVQEMESAAGIERGCTAGGALCFFISWGMGTLVLVRIAGRSRSSGGSPRS